MSWLGQKCTNQPIREINWDQAVKSTNEKSYLRLSRWVNKGYKGNTKVKCNNVNQSWTIMSNEIKNRVWARQNHHDEWQWKEVWPRLNHHIKQNEKEVWPGLNHYIKQKWKKVWLRLNHHNKWNKKGVWPGLNHHVKQRWKKVWPGLNYHVKQR